MKILPIGVKNTNLLPRKNVHQNNIMFKQIGVDSVHFGNATKQEDNQKVLILMGAPNSGKGTMARVISEKYNLTPISTGDLLRNELKHNEAFKEKYGPMMSRGEILPDEAIQGILIKRTQEPDCKVGYILDGFPRTLNQAKMLSEYYQQNLPNIKVAALKIDIPDEFLYERCAKRFVCADCGSIYSINPEIVEKEHPNCTDCGGELIKRKDDTTEVLAHRLENYENLTKPVYDYYLNMGIVQDYPVTSKDTKPEDVFEQCPEFFEDLFSEEEI